MQKKISETDIAKLQILHRVAPEAVIDVLGNCPLISMKKGQVLLHAGQSNRNIYLILSGELAVFLEYPEGEPVAILSQGEIVGELSVIDDRPTTAYVVAAENAQVLEVDETAFWRMISVSHAFACNMLLLLSARMRSSDDIILTNIKLKKRFEQDAMVDSLTGMHNRRWLDIQLPRLIDRHIRDKKPLCVIMFDIDNFKRFNDSYGHDVGDDVLVQVAKTVLLGLRPTDLSARFGGEEFVIMLAGISIDLAWIVAERLRRAISEERIVTGDGRELLPISVSMGIAESRVDDCASSLLKRADAAMYKAKNTGRNKTCREEIIQNG